MRLSQYHLRTVKEIPAEAVLASHKLMLRTGMIRKLASGLYTWSPLGLRVLRKVEAIVREEMNNAGAVELLMPSIQPRELWDETGRWEKFGGQLLKIKDRKEAEYCYGPTAEEVITDFARNEIASYKQLPVNFYQIQTKFRDEIRPRFGVMRAREFLMKDAYSFHLTKDDLAREYRNMYDTYVRIFERLGLKFRAVEADTGAIGGFASHEFQVLADSGEDAIAYSTGSEYAANIELAEAITTATRPAPSETAARVDTPRQTTCAAVAELIGLPIERTAKTICVITVDSESNTDSGDMVMAILRGDHEINEIKLTKAIGEYRLATEQEIRDALGTVPGFIGPLFDGEGNIGPTPRPIRIIADRAAAVLSDFVVGANVPKFHIRGVNWGRDLPEPALVADLRNVIEGDPAPDGQGTLRIARGIEVGHVFQLGDRYARDMNCTVLSETGAAVVPLMGCYGIGVSRIVAAAIEQNHDDAGIIWPAAMAPWQVAVCVINPKDEPTVTAAAAALYDELTAAGHDVVLDDRGLRPGNMFADIELLGIPHRVVVSGRGLESGTYEYRGRRDTESTALDHRALLARLAG